MFHHLSDQPALPQIDADLCGGCGVCVQECPTQALALGLTGSYIAFPDRCDFCGLCEAVCPTQAITCPYEIVLALPGDQEQIPPLAKSA